jgi:hypothetical protein
MSMKTALTRFAASAAVSLLLLGGAMSTTPALAGGATNSTCSRVVVQVVCVGTISGNPITVTISDNNILNGNEINVLTVNENKILNDFANENDIQTQVNDIAAENAVVLKDVLNLSVCQVKVVEVGVVNTNIANCS